MRVLQDIYLDHHVNDMYKLLVKEEDFKRQHSKSFKDMIGEKYLFQLIVGCLLSSLMQFGGINAISFYSTDIFL